MAFVALNVYSGYTFLKSGLSVKKIVASSLRRGSSFCAVADLSSFRAAPELVSLCLPRNIAPLIGVAFSFPEGRYVVYPTCEEGYRALLPLIPPFSKDALPFSSFLPALSHCVVILDAGDPSVVSKMKEDPSSYAAFLSRVDQASDSFFLGLPTEEGLPKAKDAIRAFASSFPFRLVAFPFVAYAKKEDAIVTSILRAIEEGTPLSSKEETGPFYFLNEEETAEQFAKEEIDATEEIANKAKGFQFVQKRGGLAHFPVPKGESAESYLRKKAFEGLLKRKPDAGSQYFERLEQELSVILPMGYADYFLIVADYVSYAKTHGILVGPGRGSGAGSLVSYALGICVPDPVEHGLLFERFLNVARHEMPDIDVDFEDLYRENVVHYLQEKYGKDHVAHVMTMQTMGARQSLTDVGKIYGYQPSEIRLLTSRADPRHDLAWNYKNNAAFQGIVGGDPYFKDLVSLAAKIEGLPRQSGLHAAGIVLNDAPLPEVIPAVDQDPIGLVEQFDKDDLQPQGFLKFDLLGLTNLSLISLCLHKIEESEGVRIRYEEIPHEDQAALALIAEGWTMGLFQLESEGMNRAISEVHPTSLEDLCAVIALFRPGPMANISTFAKRKAGKEPISYLCPELEPILSNTYGVIVYQEQIMQIAQAVAGFSLGEADIFRRAISHKDLEQLSSLKQHFLEGAKARGHGDALSLQLYELIERFADYGFNKSHSLCYAIIASQMAFLKAHHPLCFYASVLDYGGGGKEKLQRVLAEIKRKRIRFLLPSVNEAGLSYLPHDGGILFPLTAIRGLPSSLASGILDERIAHGPYCDFFDFALRNRKNKITLESLVALINAGAFDSLCQSRATLRRTAPIAIQFAELFGDDGQGSLLEPEEIEKPIYAEAEDNRNENLFLEKEAIGMMVSGSPLDAKKEEIEKRGLKRLSELEDSPRPIEVVGILERSKALVTKKGTKMAFMTLQDEMCSVDFTLWSDVYDKAFPLLKEGNLLRVKARKDLRRPGSYLVDQIETL